MKEDAGDDSSAPSSIEACLLEETQQQSTSTTPATAPVAAEPQLVCDIFVRWSGPSVKVDLSYVSGPAGLEGVHQLLQYLKNRQSSNK